MGSVQEFYVYKCVIAQFSSLLDPPLSLVAHTRCDDPFVDVGPLARLESSLGLWVGQRLIAACRGLEGLTGVPQGLTGCTLPFDLPLPPPWGWSAVEC